MRKSIVLFAILMVGVMAGTTSAMVAHWSDFSSVNELEARRIAVERGTALTIQSAYIFGTDPFAGLKGLNSPAPSLTASFMGGGCWGQVTDQEIAYDHFDGNTDNQYDNNPIPEPTTMVLLGMGLIGTSLVMRRRRSE